MTTDLHPELAALLSAVHSEPDCDVVRLAVADWLDEHTQSERVKCPTCLTVEASGYAQTDFLSHATGQCYKCESPNGTVGTILRQSSDGTRAEFIRVQVELAKFREPIVCDESPTTVSFNPDYPFEKWESLFAREDAILAQWGDVWRRGEECRECEGHGCLLGCAGDKRNPTCDRCQGHWRCGRIDGEVRL